MPGGGGGGAGMPLRAKGKGAKEAGERPAGLGQFEGRAGEGRAGLGLTPAADFPKVSRCPGSGGGGAR